MSPVMAKHPKPSSDPLFPIAQRRHPQLILAKLLGEKAMMLPFDPACLNAATAALTRWADLAESHALDHKEMALDAEFLRVIFCDALGYKSRTDLPDAYQLERQFSVPGAGPADGALGRFKSGTSAGSAAGVPSALTGGVWYCRRMSDSASERTGGALPAACRRIAFPSLPQTPLRR